MSTLTFQKFSLPSFAGSAAVDIGIEKCTLNHDVSSSALRKSEQVCWDMLACVTGYATGVEQAQYSSAATVLGLLPTALSLMATSTDDLLKIHSRFPILAFCMSLCNPSTISASLSSSPTIVEPFHKARSPSLRKRLNHGFPILFGKRVSISFLVHDIALHILAVLCVVMILWQTWVLGVRGVIVYACWTSHNPITWVSVGGISHLLRIITWRLTLGPLTSASSPWFQLTPRWHWNLSSHTATQLKIRHSRIARFLALMFQVIGVMNYGYGTLQFSGFTLVGPFFAIRTFTLIGFSSLISRLIAIWLLEVYPDVKIGTSDGEGGGSVLEGIELGKPNGSGISYAMIGEERMVK